jgi:OPA family glycerol-3-phosphate transporter-like MFS transporter
VSDWSPTYLQEMGLLSADDSRFAFSLFEYAGIPGTIICGWMSSKFFQGRCAPVNVIFMLVVVLGIVGYWQAAPIAAALGCGVNVVVYVALSLAGFAVYGPIAMIGIQALSFVPKNAAGTAAGFVGLFGYLLGDAVLSKIVIGHLADSSLGWGVTFWMFVAGSLVATLICAVTWGKERRMMAERAVK